MKAYSQRVVYAALDRALWKGVGLELQSMEKLRIFSEMKSEADFHYLMSDEQILH